MAQAIVHGKGARSGHMSREFANQVIEEGVKPGESKTPPKKMARKRRKK